ncbi:hypothetical protein [Spirosoma sp. 48-14]|uniref:hypothetical protein n=1 Tax=Spirosoma sp. 48-14 TaxID=1895854 RepID=UPI000966EF4B|nr:hypothetical protein [Spirosoma sp. 48-14]OJW78439.1 MAG: hypothetical protein BGO59_31035 [Spirosoma sp. 48-14]
MDGITLHNCFVAPLLRITPDMLNRVLSDVIAANAVLIADLNRKQLAAGIRADNSAISPYYRPDTVQIKRDKGQRTDRVTLHDTGDFYESIFTAVFDQAFDLEATDPKTEELKAKYGDDILGLTPENRAVLIEVIKPQFIDLLKKEIAL